MAWVAVGVAVAVGGCSGSTLEKAEPAPYNGCGKNGPGAARAPQGFTQHRSPGAFSIGGLPREGFTRHRSRGAFSIGGLPRARLHSAQVSGGLLYRGPREGFTQHRTRWAFSIGGRAKASLSTGLGGPSL